MLSFAVVPLAGTWIEILSEQRVGGMWMRRSPRGNVDEILISRLKDLSEKSRSPRGNMHWNSYQNE